MRRCFERADDIASLRFHGDCYAGNMLWTGAGPYLEDCDDSRMGPAMQDLWMPLSGDRAERGSRSRQLLAGHATFYAFNPRALHPIEALRTLRLIHHAGWLARLG